MKPPARASNPAQDQQSSTRLSEKGRLPDRVRPGPALPPTISQRVASLQTSAKEGGISSITNPPAPDEVYSKREWSDCFESCRDVSVSERNGTWRVYDAGLDSSSNLALVLLHGGGHCALSWGLVTEILRKHVAVVAFDARGHGHSKSTDDTDLSAESQVLDAAKLIQAFFEEKRPGMGVPRLVVCGHSMGGAIAVRLAAAKLLPEIVGLVVIDVVEGTALSALPYMKSWLRSRPTSFSSEESAVRYVRKAGHVRNTTSARLSVPAQVMYNEVIKRWVWRTDLEQTEQYWKGWFQGLSSSFLSVAAAKMLILANVDRLDKDLMIAQMQGKFQTILIPAAGHCVQEDQPAETARTILEYLRRNLFVTSEDDIEATVFQQRTPITPYY